MSYTIAVDFGSTYTKMAVLDLDNREMVMTARHPSTVSTDASVGLLANLSKAKEKIGETGVKNARILATSSAAGGLRMVVVGLTRRYSLLAGTNTALGAGARVIRTCYGRLSDDEIAEIQAIQPEILLLCGGVEGGNCPWLLENAEKLASCEGLFSPVIYAGSRDAAAEVRELFLRRNRECYVVENVFPELDKLNGAPAGNAIRNIFMKRITGMKGLDRVKEMIGDILMPTPSAVLAGGCLLSEGTEKTPGIGPSLICDVGGATTDIYSFIEQNHDRKLVGSPEPAHKRTVEGDLGLRSSAGALMSTMDAGLIRKDLLLSEEELKARIQRRQEESWYLPENDTERKLDYLLACQAVHVGVRRHCGKILNLYAKGASEIQEGKDLEHVRHMVGTGGPVINSIDPAGVMKKALKGKKEKELLLPVSCDFYLDRSYLLFAVGLTSSIDPEAALRIALDHITKIPDKEN